jgi:hypothetical protein
MRLRRFHHTRNEIYHEPGESMSVEYRPVSAIPFGAIDKRLEKYGIEVEMSGHITRLTFERKLGVDTEAVLNA